MEEVAGQRHGGLVFGGGGELARDEALRAKTHGTLNTGCDTHSEQVTVVCPG